METETRTISTMLLLIVALMMSKKTNKPIFGQMTLAATKALEYLKTSDEPFNRNVQKIIWIQKNEAVKDDWNIPDWVIAGEKYNWCAILVDEDKSVIPLLVYQSSAIQEIEKHLMKLERDGAKIEQVNPRLMTIDMGDESVHVGLWRHPKSDKFARYIVEFVEPD
jgi:hypothetical protein